MQLNAEIDSLLLYDEDDYCTRELKQEWLEHFERIEESREMILETLPKLTNGLL